MRCDKCDHDRECSTQEDQNAGHREHEQGRRSALVT
jgi:hypothetical protein